MANNTKNILVIGGAGYIGSRLVPRLQNLGHSVSVVDVLWFGDSLPKNVPIIKMDALELTEHAFKGFDTVIFLAGLSNDPMAEFDARLNFISNAPVPAYNAMLARKAGVKRFIYAGTCSVYGFASNDEVDEMAKPRTTFHYGVSKLMGETGCLQYQDPGVYDVISLRQGTVSGFSPRMRWDLMVNTMYMKAATEGKIAVRNPDIWRPVYAIDDVADAFIWALTAEPGVYNVASENKTVGEAAKEVAAHFKKTYGKDVALDIEHIADNRNYRVSIQKARKAGFVPKGTVKSILDELSEKFGLDADFGADIGYNMRVFEKL